MSTTSAPTAYAAAYAAAEKLTYADLLAVLTAEAPSITIIQPRRPRIYAHVTNVHGTESAHGGRIGLGFEYCTRSGNGRADFASIGPSSHGAGHGIVFDLYNRGRLVTLAPKEITAA